MLLLHKVCYPSKIYLLIDRDFMLSLSDDKQADIIDTFNNTSRYLDEILT